jgi:hypothetical protein
VEGDAHGLALLLRGLEGVLDLPTAQQRQGDDDLVDDDGHEHPRQVDDAAQPGDGHGRDRAAADDDDAALRPTPGVRDLERRADRHARADQADRDEREERRQEQPAHPAQPEREERREREEHERRTRLEQRPELVAQRPADDEVVEALPPQPEDRHGDRERQDEPHGRDQRLP